MLGDVALRGLVYTVGELLYRQFLDAEYAEQLQAQRMGHGLDGMRRAIDFHVSHRQNNVVLYLRKFKELRIPPVYVASHFHYRVSP